MRNIYDPELNKEPSFPVPILRLTLSFKDIALLPPIGRLVKFAPEPTKLVAVTTPAMLTLSKFV